MIKLYSYNLTKFLISYGYIGAFHKINCFIGLFELMGRTKFTKMKLPFDIFSPLPKLQNQAHFKGQLISRQTLWYPQFFQKTNEKIQLNYSDTSGQLVFVHFFEETKTP